MTGRWDAGDEEHSGSDAGSSRAGRDSSDHDGFWGPERSGLTRGVLLVIVAIVICVVLLPSATRAPLSVAASRTGTSIPAAPPSPTSTTSPGHSATTTTTTTAPAAATVHVLVANATTVNGVAGALTTYLGGKGFPTLTATNALTKLTTSRIYFTSGGSSAEASEVASALTLSASTIQPASAMPPVASDSGAAVVVVAGQDLAARFAPPSSTTTTKG